jgi:hypothetical protein
MESIATEAGELETAPPAAALIEVLDTHRRIHARHRLTNVGDTCTIGRSLACDIVVDDPFAAATHVSLALLDDGRVSVTDLGSRNGTRIDDRRLDSTAPAVIAGGELIVGRTHVRIRTAHSTLAPERVFRRDLLQRHQTLLAIVGLTVSAIFAAFTQWVAAPEPMAPRLLTTIVAVLGALCLWIGLWGLITRVGHGAWTLRTHAAIAANALALCLWSDWALDVAAFSTQWRWLKLAATLIVAATALGALYMHLRKATHLSIRVSLLAIVFPLALAGMGLWIAEQNNASNVNRVALGVPVYPPQLRIATSIDLNDYLAQAAALKREANRQRQISLLERPLAD